MRKLLAFGAVSGLGLLVAAAATTPGCGGCYWEDRVTTFTPAAPPCLEVRAQGGIGCYAGSYTVSGQNSCAVPLTFPALGTTLTADLVVSPGETFDVDVTTDAAGLPAAEFVLDLGGDPYTLLVEW